MKYHKIRNVPMNVCTAEQKIAYNIAWRVYLSFDREYNAARNVSRICASEVAMQARDFYFGEWMTEYAEKSRYNNDAILAALNAGLENYLAAERHVLGSYEEVGSAFPANYIDA